MAQLVLRERNCFFSLKKRMLSFWHEKYTMCIPSSKKGFFICSEVSEKNSVHPQPSWCNTHFFTVLQDDGDSSCANIGGPCQGSSSAGECQEGNVAVSGLCQSGGEEEEGVACCAPGKIVENLRQFDPTLWCVFFFILIPVPPLEGEHCSLCIKEKNHRCPKLIKQKRKLFKKNVYSVTVNECDF